MVTRQPWNSKHRNPSKAHRQKIANKKATTRVAVLVSSSLKLSGKAAKKVEKKLRRAERERIAANEAAKAAAAAAPAPAATSSTPAAAKAPKAKAAAPTSSSVAMDVDAAMGSKPRLTEIRKSRKSKASAMSDD